MSPSCRPETVLTMYKLERDGHWNHLHGQSSRVMICVIDDARVSDHVNASTPLKWSHGTLTWTSVGIRKAQRYMGSG